MNKKVSIIIIFGLLVAMIIIFSGGSQDKGANTQAVNNVEMKNGIQYITINAGGGYSPNITTATAGIPTKLIVKTNGVYDCSSSLAIHAIDYQKILPQTGETEIDLGSPKVGPLEGVCGMGMYSFMVNFK